MITRSEAADALLEVNRIDQRTILNRGYVKASPHLIFGGVIWTVGYAATGLTKPEQWGWVWLPLVVLSLVFSFGISYRSERPVSGNPAARVISPARSLWLSATITAFIVSSFLLFQPRDMLPYIAFPALVMALVYVLIGSFGAARFRWIGAGMFAVMIVGLWIGRDTIAFWTAAAGGGGLILGGLWMRKA